MNIRSIIPVVFAATCLSSVAQAVPPTQMRGVDLAAVLALHDRTRQVSQVPGTKSLKRLQTIVLDPGHGGENQGALGVGEVHEKFLTLELAYALRERIQREYPDVRVVLTRYWDQSLGLQERIALANKVQADMFISLHYNAATHPRALGYETYFLLANETIPGEEQQKGEPIATAGPITGVTAQEVQIEHRDPLVIMQEDLRRQTQNVDSGILAEVVNTSMSNHLNSINRGVKQANFGVLRGAEMPAIVVEAGFVSHPKEGKDLVTTKHRASMVNALMDAIVDFDSKIAQKNGQ